MLVFHLELSAVEEKGSEDTPSLKSCQEGNLYYLCCFYLFLSFSAEKVNKPDFFVKITEMTKVTEAVADNER